jgi:hypothetical protein
MRHKGLIIGLMLITGMSVALNWVQYQRRDGIRITRIAYSEDDMTRQYRDWAHLVELLSTHIDQLYLRGYQQALLDIGTHEDQFCIWDGRMDGAHDVTIAGVTIYTTNIGPGVTMGVGAHDITVRDSTFVMRPGLSHAWLQELAAAKNGVQARGD